MMNSCLVVKNLAKSYGDLNALKDFNLTLPEGEILGLVGPNGSGKSTLIKLIIGLLQPSGGAIEIYGKKRDKLSLSDRRSIGYIAEEPNLYEYMTVEGSIKFNRGFYPEWDDQYCRDLISRFSLPLKQRVKNLSRGMKTQLALVLALVSSPRLLVLDEPLEGLDPLRRIELLNMLLEDSMSKENRTILMSSHYLEELERIADRIAFIHEGVLKRVVPIDQLKAEEKTIRVVFQKEPPQSLLNMPGIKSVEKEGETGYLISIEDNFSAIFEACSKFPHFVLDIYHRNLEDLFNEYAGRDKDDN